MQLARNDVQVRRFMTAPGIGPIRSDLGVAQHAAAETLTTLAGRELPSLFGPTAGDVQQAFAKLGSSDRFSVLARDFFSRLTSRSLGHFLSRELSKNLPSRPPRIVACTTTMHFELLE